MPQQFGNPAALPVPQEQWDELQKTIQLALSNVREPEVMRKAAEEMDRLGETIRQREGVFDLVLPILREMQNGE